MGDLLAALPMVSSTLGAMNSVLRKLTGALEADGGLRVDLVNLHDVLNNFARRSVRHAVVNEWMLQARELIYDVEDWIDGSLLTPPAASAASDPAAMASLCSDDVVAEQIQEFKAQIQDVQDLLDTYNLVSRESAAPPVDVVAAPIQAKQLHGLAPYLELETVERQRKVILDHLRDKEYHRKVVCIMGTRGVGKTTLATNIYGELQGHFDCGAFVHLGQNPSVNKTLASILEQVNPKWRNDIDPRDNSSYCAMGPWDEQKIITTLWETLKKRSYFVVLDDLSKWTWDRISCAFPNNDQSAGRILITTCIEDVAESCCIHPRDVVHHMDNLSDDDSQRLFDSKVSFSENKSVHPVCRELLKICGGIPLAISFAAGLLYSNNACLPMTSQGMGKILEISYFDLPLPVKSCFLYLSTFPKYSAIKKDSLIRRWIAEGFVPKKDESFWETGEGFVPKGDEECLWKTGESYFSELIRRRLIQPTFDEEDDQPIGCTVHGGVLDFLISLSTEENFITAGSELKMELFPYVWVRRLCFQSSVEGEGDTLNQGTYSCVASSSNQISCSNQNQEDRWNGLHLSKVRSLVFYGNTGRMPDLGVLKFVRVLDLEDTKGMANNRLDSIGCLSLLKYLGLAGTDVIRLPQQIMEHKQLATLDLRRTRVRNLPAFVETKLISLLADALTALRKFGSAMQNLEELSKVLLGDDGSNATDVVELVKESKKLRMLGVRFGHLNDQNDRHRHGVRDLLIELGKSEVQSIFLDNYLSGLLDILVESWSHKTPPYLRKFELRMTRRPWLPEIPQDMASMTALTHLHIGVSQVQAHGVRALGSLPNLLLLRLSSDTTSPSLILSSMDGFLHLKVFWYECEYGGIQFQKGAMPELERLRLDLNVQGKICNFDFGMEHLSCLVQVRAIINCEDNSIATEVKSAIRTQVYGNDNNPVFESSRRGGQQYSSVKAGQGSVIEIHSEDEWITHIDHNKLVVVHFTAAWCGPSNMMAPFLADLAKKYPNVIFLKVDVDEVRKIAEQFDVVVNSSYKVPTFMFMRQGDTEVRVVGANEEELQETLELQRALWLSSGTC